MSERLVLRCDLTGSARRVSRYTVTITRSDLCGEIEGEQPAERWYPPVTVCVWQRDVSAARMERIIARIDELLKPQNRKQEKTEDKT